MVNDEETEMGNRRDTVQRSGSIASSVESFDPVVCVIKVGCLKAVLADGDKVLRFAAQCQQRSYEVHKSEYTDASCFAATNDAEKNE
ncbi:hypothetical protein Tcan_14856 [Toxocara canis]|uniref:Uncharacterized protein n=1 Tax=Toxocara canis TaxID=6265 RepID=A0A0B2VKF8_TOXCA|nr:hypothetical protein Tcan_14856 [Toxocara canis]